ncbi:cytochrome P450 [Guyanagaster necrorhizus]|uniref:Cytochrome P450 n=1 Tax=Guyanagaster necrorhizus TaxID=856835 RepID=A0A9P7W6L2_9AGAR|nr:cytochrome P450 [Guyanagaster necrorhizus MCA 3950]KAG7453117.1 cytochrome P450 [Guyanagaster necrorhizus MCA 3950]
MLVVLQIACTFLATLVAYGFYKLFASFYLEYTSPLKDLPGPDNPSFFFGNLKQIWASEDSNLNAEWVKLYGRTVKYTGILGGNRLITTDQRALSHILNNAYDYPKPPHSRFNLGRIVGEGLLVVEGEKHKQQRRVMNPAFGPAQIRELNTIFLEKSLQLRDLWTAECTAAEGPFHTNVLPWLSSLTLDVIGLAGFNYKFNALNPSRTPNELNEAFTEIFATATRANPLVFIKTFFPALRFLPDPRDAQINRAHGTMARIGNQLLNESHARLRASGEKGSSSARDLLSLLVKANMSSDVGEHQRMADSDVLAQVPTFLVAGHETTSTATTWALFALTQSPESQIKLRDELLQVDTDTPTMDELSALPYLDWVVRETLRVHSPVPSTIRCAGKDDVIPLSQPFTDRKGRVQDSIRIRKGQTILIPISTVNRDEALWGEDAKEFKPERWEKIPDAVKSIPGVWGNMLSFIGGPRSCIGYRFSLVEMKAIMFTLLRAFEFELAVPGAEIAKRSTIVQRPLLRNNPGAGNQLPIIIKPYQRV